MGWTGVSQYYGAGVVEGTLDPREAFEPALAAAQKAVELDESLPEAHMTLCATVFFYKWDWARADRECARVAELDPNIADFYFLKAKIYSALHRPDDAIEAAKKSIELDPFARSWQLGYMYWEARRYDAALEEFHQRLEVYAHDPMTLAMLSDTYRCKKMYKEAVDASAGASAGFGDPKTAANMRRAFRQGGYRAVLLLNVADMKKRLLKHYVSPVDLALQYAQLGEKAETLALLEEGYRQRSPDMLYIQNDPAYDFLHSDEQYRSLIKQIGLPPTY